MNQEIKCLEEEILELKEFYDSLEVECEPMESYSIWEYLNIELTAEPVTEEN